MNFFLQVQPASTQSQWELLQWRPLQHQRVTLMPPHHRSLGDLSCSNFLSEGMLARRLMIPKPPPTLHVRRSLTPLRLRSQFRAALLLTDKKFTAAANRQRQEGSSLHPAWALFFRSPTLGFGAPLLERLLAARTTFPLVPQLSPHI